MVAPLIAAAARAGGTAGARKIAARTTITRTRAGEAQVVQNARAIKKPGVGDYLRAANTGYKAASQGGRKNANDNESPAANDNERSLSETLSTNDNEPRTPASKPRPLTSRGSRLPVAGKTQKPIPGVMNTPGQENNEQTEAGFRENDESQEQDQRRLAQERVRRLRETGTTGRLTLDEGFAREQDKAKKHKPHLILYMPAFSVAIFKDVLDWVGIGSLPAIGTVITIVCSILIFTLLLLFRANKQLADSRFILRMFTIIVIATLFEFLFGINFLPIETISVYLVYFMDKHISNKHIAELASVSRQLKKKPIRI
jgi:hypothetical protein